MTKKERVQTVINGGIPDVTPYYIDLTLVGKKKMAEYYKVRPDSLQKIIGSDLFFCKFTWPEDFSSEPMEADLFKDEFGVVWDTGSTSGVGDWGLIGHPIQNMEVGDYQFPTGKGEGRFTDAQRKWS